MFSNQPAQSGGDDTTITASWGFNTDRGLFGIGGEYVRSNKAALADRDWTRDCTANVEIDENGHEGYDCFNEDARLELIAADVGKPGVVLRIDPDAEPMLKRRKLKGGEVAWGATSSFDLIMNEIQYFLEWVLRRQDVRNTERHKIAHLGDLGLIRNNRHGVSVLQESTF